MRRDDLACPPLPARCPPPQRTVLVVEDDLHAAKLLSVQLRREGYGVSIAHSGEDALRQLERFLPLAIILDLLLPHMDGWEVLARVKAAPCTCEVPVIILSVLDRQTLGFELGASEYLVKPVDRSELLHAIHCAEQRRHTGRSARVLLVHADPDRLTALAASLYENGYDVIEALSEAEALDLAARGRPDLAVVDLLVSPGGCRRLIADLQSQALPVLVLTGDGAPALDMGARAPAPVRTLAPGVPLLSIVNEMFEQLSRHAEDVH